MKSYKSAHWIFDENKQELKYLDGTTKRLPARLNNCLASLLKAQGQTVIYDELLEAVWGTIYRDYNTIASVVSELRKLINCRSSKVNYIVTVPKKGYRFSCYEHIQLVDSQENSALEQNIDSHNTELKDVATEIEPQLAPQNAIIESPQVIKSPSSINTVVNSSSSFTGRKKALTYSLALVILLIVCAAVLLRPYFSSDNLNIHSSKTEVLTHEYGRELEFDLSQDKQWLAYVHENDLGKDLLLKNIKTGITAGLFADQNLYYSSPSFNYTNNALLYLEHSDRGCEMFQIGINNEGFLANEKRKITHCGLKDSWVTTAYDKHSDAVFFARSESIAEPYRIFKHDLQTGYERNITSPPSTGRGDYSFALSPDGLSLAFVRNVLWEKSSIWLLNLANGETRQLFEIPYLLESIAWMGDHAILYSTGHDLMRFNLASKESELVKRFSKPVKYPNTDESNIYVSRGQSLVSDIWQLNLQRLTTERIIASDYIDSAPIISAQGTLFLSNRSGHHELWQRGGNQEIKVMDLIGELEKVKNIKELDHEFLVGILGGRIVKINKTSHEVVWLSAEEKKIDSFTLSAKQTKLVYATELNEAWFIEQLDIATGKLEFFGIEGFTAKYWQNKILLTNFRAPGLWLYDPITRERQLIDASFEVFSANKWAVLNNHLILVKKNEVSVFALNAGQLTLIKALAVPGDPRSISCDSVKQVCQFDLFAKGSTEIIKLAF
ncbi:winged helix-turn-helix domain-containing protein [Pseudoalteromonas tunicata]|uniref:winged helix-turn-helix domain-containing protein n=1 Tax=Pseudoalteromonas tunicata TaxID=314281 RepID=UPI00273DDEB3|nr:winged helix-turn-helix domain-containing protein [Pseudoalteromonas tunicata]MDP5212342.1 winged helix-turn-helix domain-containing protein [Pseudoalteromonas tunicata]